MPVVAKRKKANRRALHLCTEAQQIKVFMQNDVQFARKDLINPCWFCEGTIFCGESYRRGLHGAQVSHNSCLSSRRKGRGDTNGQSKYYDISQNGHDDTSNGCDDSNGHSELESYVEDQEDSASRLIAAAEQDDRTVIELSLDDPVALAKSAASTNGSTKAKMAEKPAVPSNQTLPADVLLRLGYLEGFQEAILLVLEKGLLVRT